MKTTILQLVQFQTKGQIFFKAEAFVKLFFYAGYPSTISKIEGFLNELVEQGLVEVKSTSEGLTYCSK